MRPVASASNHFSPHPAEASDPAGPNDIVLPTGKPSAFFGTQLGSILSYLGVDSLIVTGVVTSGCVRATVVDAFSLNYRVVVPADCVADRFQLSHRVSLIDMGAKYADIVRLEELLEDGGMRRSLQNWAGSARGDEDAAGEAVRGLAPRIAVR